MRPWTLAAAAAALVTAAWWHLPAAALRVAPQPAASELITFEQYRDFRLHDLAQRQARLAQQLAAPGLSPAEKTSLESRKAYYDQLAAMPEAERDALYRRLADEASYQQKLRKLQIAMLELEQIYRVERRPRVREDARRRRRPPRQIIPHTSDAEQLRRFQERIATPTKRWKMSAEDIRNRAHRGDYLAALDDMFALTSPTAAPWHVVPAEYNGSPVSPWRRRWSKRSPKGWHSGPLPSPRKLSQRLPKLWAARKWRHSAWPSLSTPQKACDQKIIRRKTCNP